MTRLVIDRAKWGRGFGSTCALSFADAQIDNFRDAIGDAEWVRIRGAVMTANDGMDDGPEREQRIAELFAQAGVSVVYVGDYQ